MPVKASRLASVRTIDSLRSIRSIAGWMLNDPSSASITYTPADVRRTMHTDGDRLAAMQAELAWELGWSASTLDQRAELTQAVLALQRSLVVSARDGPFLVDLPNDLAQVMRPAISVFSQCACSNFHHSMRLKRLRRGH
jgi:hypothetical protein